MSSRAIVAVAVLAAAVASGCGASSSAAPGPPAASSTTAQPARKTIDPNFDFGQTVLITPAGIRPKWLVSLVGKPIVWHNDSHRVVTVVFDHQSVHSPPIPPGGTFTYRPPTAISISYHSGGHHRLHGMVQVTPASQ
ncbi:MAG: hypothetical protein ACTHNU_01730 [Gaiellales bacterium]